MNGSEDKKRNKELWDRFRQDTAPVVSTCPDENDLAGLLDGRLNDKAREALEEHLATCDTCLEAFQELRSILGEAGEDAPPGVADRARALTIGKVRPFPERSRLLAYLRIAAAAASIVAACAGGWHLGSGMVLSANQAGSEMRGFFAPLGGGDQDNMTGVWR